MAWMWWATCLQRHRRSLDDPYLWAAMAFLVFEVARGRPGRRGLDRTREEQARDRYGDRARSSRPGSEPSEEAEARQRQGSLFDAVDEAVEP